MSMAKKVIDNASIILAEASNHRDKINAVKQHGPIKTTLEHAIATDSMVVKGEDGNTIATMNPDGSWA